MLQQARLESSSGVARLCRHRQLPVGQVSRRCALRAADQARPKKEADGVGRTAWPHELRRVAAHVRACARAHLIGAPGLPRRESLERVPHRLLLLLHPLPLRLPFLRIICIVLLLGTISRRRHRIIVAVLLGRPALPRARSLLLRHASARQRSQNNGRGATAAHPDRYTPFPPATTHTARNNNNNRNNKQVASWTAHKEDGERRQAQHPCARMAARAFVWQARA